MAENPQVADEQRLAARRLLQEPLLCAEHDPDVFRLVRRHEDELDRWFTQRLGYRLRVNVDTARLAKGGWVTDRPLRTATGRPFHQLEYVTLTLTLAATIAGPDVVSLRDLVDRVRTAAVDASVVLGDDGVQRRAQVTALKWMIDRGLAAELHDRIDAYQDDAEADAVLRTRPDRIALLPLPPLHAIDDDTTVEELLARADRRTTRRTWLRARLVEDPVLYRSDLTDDEWDELRRRQGEEARFLDEMFGLVLEARAEGVAAIDPDGRLSEVRFPATGTVAHAALLLIGALHERPDPFERLDDSSLHAVVAAITESHAKRWKADLVERPDQLLDRILELLVPLRLADVDVDDAGTRRTRLLPAASRYRVVIERPAGQSTQLGLL